MNARVVQFKTLEFLANQLAKEKAVFGIERSESVCAVLSLSAGLE